MRLLAFVSVVLMCLGASGQAQDQGQLPVASPILMIDSERLFEDSQFGRDTIVEIEELGAELSAENGRIQKELEREEQRLTELRPTISPEEFRPLADAFDLRVQETRRAQDAKSRELTSKLESRRVTFLNAAVPILEQLMREAGAAVVLERRSVFISSNLVDITQIAIDRLDGALEAQDIPQDQP